MKYRLITHIPHKRKAISATNIQNAYDGEYKIKDIKDNHVQ